MPREQCILDIPRDTSDLPHHEVTIHSSHPFMRMQAGAKTYRSRMPSWKNLKDRRGRTSVGSRFLTRSSACVSCAWNPSTRTSADRWMINWQCEDCGHYKISKEMVTHFLMGVKKNIVDPTDIDKYKHATFPWVELKHSEREPSLKMTPIYMQVACVAQRGGECVREALRDADFYASPGVFDILARGWNDNRDWSLTAVRLQGIIMINHEMDRNNFKGDWKGQKEQRRVNTPAPSDKQSRRVKHFQLVRSDLRTKSGKSLSLCVLVEYSIDRDGEPIRNTMSQIKYNPYKMDGDGELSRSIGLQLSRINRISHTDGRKEIHKWTLEEMRARYDEKLEQRSWDFLVEVLSLIKECLPIDGEYCTINLGPNKERRAGPRGFFKVQNKGPIDPNCLRPDFREKYRI